MGVNHVTDWIHQRHSELHMRRWTLGFDDPAAEREFRRYDDRAGVRPAQWALVVGLVLHTAYAAAEPFLFDEGLAEAVLLRLVSAILPFLIATIVLRRSSWARTHLQIGLVVLLTLSMVGFTASAYLTPFETPYIRGACTIALLGVIGITRMRMQAAGCLVMIYLGANIAITHARVDEGDLLAVAVAPTAGTAAVALVIAYMLERLRRTDFLSQRAAEFERDLSDDLLHSILPVPIADRLRQDRGAIADSAPSVSVLFADIVDFTPLSESLPPERLVAFLDTVFTEFDALCELHAVEKVKTIGDAYMAVAGVPNPDPDHAGSLAELAIAMHQAAARISTDGPTPLSLRIGISTGPVVAGVIGQRKFAYDLWGDTVNTASRMESHGEPDRIQVSAATHALLRDRYAFTGPHRVEVKGKGTLTTYYLDRRLP